MSVKNVCTSILVSVAAVSLIACDSNESKQGAKKSTTAKVKVETAMETELAAKKAEVNSLYEERKELVNAPKAIEDAIELETIDNAINKARADIEAKHKELEQARQDATMPPFPNNDAEIEAINNEIVELSKIEQENLEKQLDIFEASEEETKKIQEIDKKLKVGKLQVEKIENSITIKNLETVSEDIKKRSKDAYDLISADIERRTTRNTDITMELKDL